MKFFKTIFILGFLLWTNVCYAQNHSTAGGFLLQHYGVKTYDMHPRNFYITQDNRGFMYFGNAYGVIQYDGNNWSSIYIPNGKSALSLLLNSKGELLVGSYNEFGTLTPEKEKTLTFKSLFNKNLLHNTGEIINIIEHESAIIYQSLKGLYCYNSFGQIKTILPAKPSNEFLFAQKINKKIFVQQSNLGLQILENQKLQLVAGGEQFKKTPIKSILPFAQQELLIAQEDGLFILQNNTLHSWNATTNLILKKHPITQALVLEHNKYLVTTKDNGFYILNAAGEILQHISTENGLSNNTINYAYTDKQGGLWLALDNGITYIEINSPFLFLNSASGLNGMGYTATIFKDKLYVGTSEGLFYSFLKNKSYTFKPVSNIKGQIWNLSVINNTLLCCQNEHSYQIQDTKAILIPSLYDNEGHWKFSPLKHDSTYALKGTYEGFQLYQFKNGHWEFAHKLKGFSESARIFEEDNNGNIWVCHGNKGIYKIMLSNDLSNIKEALNFSVEKGYAPDFFNDINIINQHLIFAGDDGPYVLNAEQTSFTKDPTIENIIGENIYINRLVQYENDELWLFSKNDVYVYSTKQHAKNNSLNQNALKKVTGRLIGSYEFVYPIQNKTVLIGSQEGAILFNTQEKNKKNIHYTTFIRKIEAPFHQDSILFYGTPDAPSYATWNYDCNALRFSYATPYYENSEKIKYQYALLSNQHDTPVWSGWTSNTQVEFSNLREGTYIFQVHSKNIYDEISEKGMYKFTINPPWYRSFYAYLFYSCSFIALSFLLYQYIKTRFKKQKDKLTLEKKHELLLLEQKHIAEKLMHEKERIVLQKKSLEAEVILKNNELATLATSLTQKTEFLSHLKDKLENINKVSPQDESPLFKEVIKTIDQDLDFDDNWTNFQLHFDQIHHNFLHRLRAQFPKLNPSWLLLCAYIRMNKSNKEIAAHLNISVAGVEKRKYRLKEKLELEPNEKLADFIISF